MCIASILSACGYDYCLKNQLFILPKCDSILSGHSKIVFSSPKNLEVSKESFIKSLVKDYSETLVDVIEALFSPIPKYNEEYLQPIIRMFLKSRDLTIIILAFNRPHEKLL